MDTEILNTPWETMTHEEKNRVLFQEQKELLDTFLEKRAISREQYNKSLHDLTEKMGIKKAADSV